MLAILCALLSALLYSVASVFQQYSAEQQDDQHALTLGLMTRLVRQPVWLVGIGADLLAFVFQFIALNLGTLVLVQPLLVCGLLFALPLEARFKGRKFRQRDGIAALAVCVGLGVFQGFADPRNGRSLVSLGVWSPLIIATLGAGFILAGVGYRSRRYRPVWFAASAGVIYGLASGLVKTVGYRFSHHFWTTFTHWELYALVVIGAIGMVIAQSAFQAGGLDLSLPTMSCVDPVISILVGALAFNESVAHAPGAIVAEVVGLGIMILGVFGLTTGKTPQPEGQIPTRHGEDPASPAGGPRPDTGGAGSDNIYPGSDAGRLGPDGSGPEAGRNVSGPEAGGNVSGPEAGGEDPCRLGHEATQRGAPAGRSPRSPAPYSPGPEEEE